jgi:arylsulfatase A-like enzyme
MYDKFIRVPMMIYDPRRSGASGSGRRGFEHRHRPDDFWICRLKPAVGWQGLNLSAYTQAKSPAKTRTEFLCEHLWKVDIIAASEGYRTKKWKYFRYREDMAHEELYDLSKDPLEKNNLAGNEQNMPPC